MIEKLQAIINDINVKGEDVYSIEDVTDLYNTIVNRLGNSVDSQTQSKLDFLEEIYVEKLGGCFVAGTLVLTRQGYKSIEDIVVGDEVLAYNQFTGEQAYQPVKRLLPSKTLALYHIETENGMISVTPDHPIYTSERGFVKAEELQVTDKMVNAR